MKTLSLAFFFMLMLLFVLNCTSGEGETISFFDGTLEEGSLEYVNHELFLVAGETRHKMQKHQITEIRDRTETYREYRMQYNSIDLSCAEELLELAQWAYKNFLMPECYSLYLKILEVDKNHYEAREALFYVDNGGKWKRTMEDEYKYREDRLRCGDEAGYEKLALWAQNNGVSDGARECAFYLLRMNPYNEVGKKIAIEELKGEALSFTSLPVSKFKVEELVKKANASVYDLFSRKLEGSGGSLFGTELKCPVDAKVEYIQNVFADLTVDDGVQEDRDNFIQLSINGISLIMGGLGKDTFKVKDGQKVSAGQSLAMVGNPSGGTPHVKIRILNKDKFSIPFHLPECSLTRGGKTSTLSKFYPQIGDIITASASK